MVEGKRYVLLRDAHIHRGRSLVTEIDFGDNVAGHQMEIVSCLGNWAIVGVGCGGSRLVSGFQGDRTVESTIRIAVVWLRLGCNAYAFPALEEPAWVLSVSMMFLGIIDYFVLSSECSTHKSRDTESWRS